MRVRSIMNTGTVILFLMSLLQNLSAQGKGKLFQWSEEYKEKGLLRLVSGSEDGIIALNQYKDYGQRTDRIELVKYNNDLFETARVELRDLENFPYVDVATIDSPEGVAHIYHVTTKSGKRTISAQLFDKSTLAKKDILDFARFKVYKNSDERFFFDNNNIPQYPVNIHHSDDQSLLAITYAQENVGRDRSLLVQYAVVDLLNGFGMISSGEIETDYSSNKYDVSDIHLSNSGRLSILLKEYDNNSNEEFANRKPAYDYVLYHEQNDTVGYVYDIKVKDKFMDRLLVTSDSEDNIYIAGLERKAPIGKSTNSYLISLDDKGELRFSSKDKYSKRESREIHGKEKKELHEDYETVDLKMANDILYIIRQDRSITTRTRDNNSLAARRRFNRGFDLNNNFITDYYWNRQNVIVEGIGKETGDRLWLTINHRKHEEDTTFERYFTSDWCEVVNGDLYFIYNERAENIERIRKKEKLKKTDIPGDDTAPLVVKIDKDGNIGYRDLQNEGEYHITNGGIRVYQDYIYSVLQKDNYKNFYVGRIPLDVLDF